MCCLVTSLLSGLSWTSLQMYLTLAILWVLPILYFFLPESLSWLIVEKQLERLTLSQLVEFVEKCKEKYMKGNFKLDW